MFSSAVNPYDELIIKATDENLASEDWAINMEVCDKVSGDGTTGARNAVAALQKRLAHRNPNVQLYALELANTLAQNCDRPLLEELSSRNWTGALDRLVNDRTTATPVKKKALGYIKSWAKQFEDTGDSNLGLMGELYDQLRAKGLSFDEPEPVPETVIDERQRREEEELQRVLELSKQDKGGRNTYQPSQTNGSSSSSYPAVTSQPQPQPSYNPTPAAQAYVPPAPEPEPGPVDINTATRVRALYTFTTVEVGELNFERGDIIKVLDRGFKEWWRGACNGKIGIFPVTYVEGLPEPTPRELQEEAQEEARVFASLGLVDQLLQTLKDIDPSRGDRLDDRPEVEDMYQASVGLQGQINALIKKYSDQKAELEHMNANFLRAMKQYEELRNPQPQYGYAPSQDPYGQQYAQQPVQQGYPQQPYQPQPQAYVQQPAEQYPQHAQHPQQTVDPAYPQQNPQAQYSQFPQPHTAQAQAQTQAPSYSSPPPQQQAYAPPPINTAVASAPGEAALGQFYQQNAHSQASLTRAPTGAPDLPPTSPRRQGTQPGAAGLGAGADPNREHQAAWDAYYAQQGQTAAAVSPGAELPQYSQSQQQHQEVPQQAYGASPYPVAQRVVSNASVDNVAAGVGRMSVHGQ